MEVSRKQQRQPNRDQKQRTQARCCLSDLTEKLYVKLLRSANASKGFSADKRWQGLPSLA